MIDEIARARFKKVLDEKFAKRELDDPVIRQAQTLAEIHGLSERDALRLMVTELSLRYEEMRQREIKRLAEAHVSPVLASCDWRSILGKS